MLNAIGFPLYRHGEEPVERLDALLRAAYLYKVPAYAYDLNDVPRYIQTGTIPAIFWDGGAYSHCEIDLPKHTEIYCSTSCLCVRNAEELDWIFEHTIPTDRFGLGKTVFQRKLLFSDLAQYAVPTIALYSYDQLVQNAVLFPVSFLKPASASRARGAMKLRVRDGKIYYSTPEANGELTEQIFNEYYSDAGFSGTFKLLLEPCLNILNDDGRAVDFRCLVSLNGKGAWQNVLTYARIGGSAVASNFSHGGSLNFAEEVLEQMLPGHGKEKLAEINAVALKIAEFVQRESPNTVSWLGLDICMDRPSNQIYVIEANSKPGVKFIGPWPLALVRAQYYQYLLSKSEADNG